MAEIEWRKPKQDYDEESSPVEVTLSAAQVLGMAELVERENAAALRVRYQRDNGKADEFLQVATWDPVNKWFGPYSVRAVSGHVIPPR